MPYYCESFICIIIVSHEYALLLFTPDLKVGNSPHQTTFMENKMPPGFAPQHFVSHEWHCTESVIKEITVHRVSYKGNNSIISEIVN